MCLFVCLNETEEDYDAFCLAYMFTYRDFEMGTLGLAWTGDLKNAGGVCEKNGVRISIIVISFSAFIFFFSNLFDLDQIITIQLMTFIVASSCGFFIKLSESFQNFLNTFCSFCIAALPWLSEIAQHWHCNFIELRKTRTASGFTCYFGARNWPQFRLTGMINRNTSIISCILSILILA